MQTEPTALSFSQLHSLPHSPYQARLRGRVHVLLAVAACRWIAAPHSLHGLAACSLRCCAVCRQEFGKHGDEWHRLYAGYPSGVYKVNAVEMTEPLAPYEMLCGLLVPLYVPRVTEEVFYGRRGVTLQTSREVCFEAAP